MIIAVDTNGDNFKFGKDTERKWNSEIKKDGCIEVHCFSKSANFFPAGIKGFIVDGQFWPCGNLTISTIHDYLHRAE